MYLENLWCAKLYGKVAQDVGIFPSISTYGVLPYAMIFCAFVSLSNNDRFPAMCISYMMVSINKSIPLHYPDNAMLL